MKFWPQKNKLNPQDELFDNLDEIGRFYKVMLIEGDTDAVLRFIDILNESFDKFWQLRIANPQRFIDILFDKDFIARSPFERGPKADTSQILSLFGSSQINTFQRPFYAFYKFNNFYINFWKYAFDLNNHEICLRINKAINKHIQQFSFDQGNDAIVNILLMSLFELSRHGLTNKDLRYSNFNHPESLYYPAYRWYTSMLLKYQYDLPNDLYVNEYLQYYDQWFWYDIKLMIDCEYKVYLNAFIATLYDGIFIPSHEVGNLSSGLYKFWDRFNREGDSDLVKESSALTNNMLEQSTQREFDMWQKALEDLIDKVIAVASDEESKELELLKADSLSIGLVYYRFNRLKEFMHLVGSYILFKKEYNLISDIWYYKQPPDADAHYVGHDILPDSLFRIMHLLLRIGYSKMEHFNLFGDHHGVDGYLNQYFILMIMRLRKIGNTYFGVNVLDSSFIGQGLNSDQLQQLKYSINTLKNYISIVTGNEELLRQLRLKLNDVNWNNEIEELLNSCISTIDRKTIAEIIKIRITDAEIIPFYTKILDSYNSQRSLIKFLRIYNLFRSVDQMNQDIIEIGVDTIEDEYEFKKKWQNLQSNVGELYGYNLALIENAYLIEQLSKVANQIPNIRIDELEANLIASASSAESQVLLFVNENPYIFFDNSNHFFPPSQYSENGFSGTYTIENVSIPIYTIQVNFINWRMVYLLDHNKLGSVSQFNVQDENVVDKQLHLDLIQKSNGVNIIAKESISINFVEEPLIYEFKITR